MSSTIGKLFRVTTFGESHGLSLGAVVDGCPAGLKLTEADLQPQLTRRRPGQSSLTTPRNEYDEVRILSGVEGGVTLGSPIALVIESLDKRPADYSELSNIPRPSHADMTYRAKYGISASSGGGRSSARETAARVAGGALAEKYIRDQFGIEIVAWVSAVGSVVAPDMIDANITRDKVDVNNVRCPDPESAELMIAEIHDALEKKDSLGGIVTCVCRNVPAGWGEPIFDKIEAMLGYAILSMPAVKGFDIGSGFAGTRMRGSEHNDMFVMKGDRLGTVTNKSGGVQGGITNGESIVFRTAIKPVATIGQQQNTVDYNGAPVTLQISKGRHDPCVLPRAVPVVESMAAIVLADASLYPSVSIS